MKRSLLPALCVLLGAELAPTAYAQTTPGFPDPQQAQSLFRQGFDLLQQKRHAEAQQAFEQGLKLNPNEYRAHFYLGGICELTKRCSFAQSYHAVLKLAPRDSQEYAVAQQKAGHIPVSDYTRFAVPREGSSWDVKIAGVDGANTYRVTSVTTQHFIVTSGTRDWPARSKHDLDGNLVESEIGQAGGSTVRTVISPNSQDFQFPLQPGKIWSYNNTSNDGQSRITTTGQATVRGFETVSSARGDIEAVRIEFRAKTKLQPTDGSAPSDDVTEGTCLYVPGFPGCYMLLDEKGGTLMAVTRYDLRF